jgi:uncharacterized Zn finger protein (UPF0148 family)
MVNEMAKKTSICPECNAPLFLDRKSGKITCDNCDWKVDSQTHPHKVIEDCDDGSNFVILAWAKI